MNKYYRNGQRVDELTSTSNYEVVMEPINVRDLSFSA